jgi:hypothetical protein
VIAAVRTDLALGTASRLLETGGRPRIAPPPDFVERNMPGTVPGHGGSSTEANANASAEAANVRRLLPPPGMTTASRGAEQTQQQDKPGYGPLLLGAIGVVAFLLATRRQERSVPGSEYLSEGEEDVDTEDYLEAREEAPEPERMHELPTTTLAGDEGSKPKRAKKASKAKGNSREQTAALVQRLKASGVEEAELMAATGADSALVNAWTAGEKAVTPFQLQKMLPLLSAHVGCTP